MYRVEFTDKDGWNKFALVYGKDASEANEALQRAERGTATITRVVPLDKDTFTRTVTVRLEVEVGFEGPTSAFEGWTKDELDEQAVQAAATMLVNEAVRGDVSGAIAKRMRPVHFAGAGNPDTIVTVS